MSFIEYFLSTLNTPIFGIEGTIGFTIAIIIVVSMSKRREEIDENMFPIMLSLHVFGINVNFLGMIIMGIIFVMAVFGYNFFAELITRVRGEEEEDNKGQTTLKKFK